MILYCIVVSYTDKIKLFHNHPLRVPCGVQTLYLQYYLFRHVYGYPVSFIIVCKSKCLPVRCVFSIRTCWAASKHFFSCDMEESMGIGFNYWGKSEIIMILCFTADCRLPKSIEEFIQNVLSIAISIGLIILVFLWFLVALFLFAALFLFFSRIFRCAIRNLKHLENTSRSPIYSRRRHRQRPQYNSRVWQRATIRLKVRLVVSSARNFRMRICLAFSY